MKILIIHSGNAVSCSSDYSFVNEQGESLKRAGADVSYYAVRGRGVKGYLRNLKAIRKNIAAFQPDIIHAHYGLCGALAILQHKVPVVITFHNGETLTRKGRLISSIASHMSAFNIYVAKHIKTRLHVPDRRYTILPCGVDIDMLAIYGKEQACIRLGLDGNAKNILFAGSFSNPRKNYPLAQEAVGLLERPVNLIEMKGWTREQVPYLLCACDLLLLPTKSEGSPQVVKEAMACNCPVVATDVADISWLLDGVSNSYVTSFSAEEIAGRVNEVLDNGKRSDGRRRVFELGLDNESVASRLMSIYKKVLGDE